MIGPVFYTVGNGDGDKLRSNAASDDVGAHGGSAEERWAPVLRAAESGARRGGVRCVRGSAVRVVLRGRGRPSESGAGPLFPAAAARLL